MSRINSQILNFKDKDDYLVDKILVVAGQKGTGQWTIERALDKNCDIAVITSAVAMRNLSVNKDLREDLSHSYPRETATLRYSPEYNSQI